MNNNFLKRIPHPLFKKQKSICLFRCFLLLTNLHEFQCSEDTEKEKDSKMAAKGRKQKACLLQ
jgi:hypothetical protein